MLGELQELLFPKEYYSGGVIDDQKKIVEYIASKFNAKVVEEKDIYSATMRGRSVNIGVYITRDNLKTIDITIDSKTVNVSTKNVDIILNASPVLLTSYITDNYIYIGGVSTGSIKVRVEARKDENTIRIVLSP